MKEFRFRQMHARWSARTLAHSAFLVASTALMSSAALAQAPALVAPSFQAPQAPTPPTPPAFVQPPAIPQAGNSAVPPGTVVPPAPPTTRMELPGVPFPSMVQQGQRNIPLSNQPLGFDPARTQENMGQLNSQVQERMQNLREGAGLPAPGRAPNVAAPAGQGGMTPPPIGSYANELQEMAERQRNARLLQAQRAEAEAAMALYGILFDTRREEEAARRAEREREDRERAERERQERERAQREAAPVASGGQPQGSTGQQQSIDAATRMELPLPRIVTVFGSAGSLRATLLVPYVGEVNAGPGTLLPGERRVVSVTNEGVVVSDPRMGRVSLGFGDMVPAAPPQRTAAPGGFAPPAGFTAPTPPPIPQAPQPPQPPR